jgi:DNA-binding NarL/FixJ family response regulator
MNVPTRIVIADDHAIIRAGLLALLSSHSDLTVVGEASNGVEAVALWRETRPDVGLFDLRMPGLDGIEALRQIRKQQPQATVIVLTAMARDADIERAIDAGASGYLAKDAPISEIVAGIRSARAGESRELDRLKRRLSKLAAHEALTPREAEVLQGVAGGRSNHRISEVLGIGEGTVKTHLKRIYGKMAVRNRTEAVAVARQKGLLQSPP